jgi:hypothetical protein
MWQMIGVLAELKRSLITPYMGPFDMFFQIASPCSAAAKVMLSRHTANAMKLWQEIR